MVVDDWEGFHWWKDDGGEHGWPALVVVVVVLVVVAGNSKEEKGGGGFGSHQGKGAGETFYQGGEGMLTTKMGDLNGG